jgi:hypothetical protein
MDQPSQRLALIEVTDREARSPRFVDVRAWPVRIGRAIDNEVVVEDPHLAPCHAAIAVDQEGRLCLTVHDAVNGATQGAERLVTGVRWPLPPEGAVLQMGTTRLRIRLPGETLAATAPLGGGRTLQPSTVAACGVALLALQLAEQWLALDPGADLAIWLPLLLGMPTAVAAWCGVWALLSKLFQHRFDFSGHLRIALPWLLAVGLLDALWPQLAASLGQPWLWSLSPPLQGLLGVLLVRAHLLHLLPQHPRAVTAALGALALSAVALSATLTLRSTDRLSSAPYMSTLPLPTLRMAGTVPVGEAVEAMGPLADKLARRAQKARTDDETTADAEAD